MAILQKTKELVKSLLIRHPELRDDDFSLYMAAIAQSLRQKNLYTTEIQKVLRILNTAHKDNIIPNPESVRRSRQKLQEDEPDLRGQKYYDRPRRGAVS